MANHCSNLLIIETSVKPHVFLTPVLNERGEVIPDEWTFECKESICPFNDPSGKSPFPFWWTKWVDTHHVTKEEITEPLPPEPEPIMITEWTRRYPLYTGPKKKPYKYTRWTIDFTSAWAPPENYMEYLQTLLLSIDDRTRITMYFEEPGCDLLGYWEDGNSYCDDRPITYYSSLLDKDVIGDIDAVPESWLKFNDPDNFYEPNEAISALSSIATPDAQEEILEIKSTFNLD